MEMWSMRKPAKLISVWVALAPTGAGAQNGHELSFSRVERKVISHNVEVDVDATELHGHAVLVAKRLDEVKGEATKLSWADAETCPAMRPAFARLQTIEAFKIVPPGVRGGATDIVLDGNQYRVEVGGYWPRANRDGDIVLSGNDGTPVANWVEETLRALASCWRSQRPAEPSSAA